MKSSAARQTISGAPMVSVIIPTYNRAQMLEQTVLSVLTQTYADFELLVLDDGSTDQTAEVLQRFDDKRLRCIRHRKNIGFTANWTFGVKHASGKYLAILGDDDYYKSDFLMRRVTAFEHTPELLAVTGAFDCCDAEGQSVRKSIPPCSSDTVFSNDHLVDLTLGKSGEWFNGATLYKTTVVQSLWNNVMFAGTALDLTLHIYLSLMPDAKVLFLAQSDMVLRVHAEQESVRNRIFIAESAAFTAIKLWHTKIKPGKIYVSKFRNRFSCDIDHFGRILWDAGSIGESRQMFKQELLMKPYAVQTWLRYLRTFMPALKK